MRSAVRAPAYPEALATRTLFTERPPDLRHGLLDRLAPLRDLLVGEGPVGSTEAEAEGEALAALAELLAAIEVEDLRRTQKLTAAIQDRRSHAGGGNGVIDHHRHVLL